MNNIALLILRVVFAGSILYGHGLGKLNSLIEGNLSFPNPIGIGETPTFILAVFSEFLAPIFIIVGYKTKFFSFFPFRKSGKAFIIFSWIYCNYDDGSWKIFH